jgi:hypothetical protein
MIFLMITAQPIIPGVASHGSVNVMPGNGLHHCTSTQSIRPASACQTVATQLLQNLPTPAVAEYRKA